MLKFNLAPRPEREFNPETKGKNVEVRLIFARHGEKDMKDREKGWLTEKGRQQFRDFALEKLADPNRNLIVYGTDVARTIQSGLEALGKSVAKVKVYPAPQNELSFKIGQSMDRNETTKVSRPFLNKLKSMPIGDNVRHYIGYRYQRPDAESFSPQETAGGIAKIIVGYNKKIDVMKSGSKNDVLMVSHDFVLSAFLQEVLGIELQESKKNMNPAESFEVIINTDSSGKHVLDCVYEGKRYSIPPDLLNSFAQKYEAAKEQN